MRKIPVSSLLLQATPVVIEERDPESNLTVAQPLLSLKFGPIAVEVTLSDIQDLKVMFGKAERHLLLRKEQALKSRNLTLDL